MANEQNHSGSQGQSGQYQQDDQNRGQQGGASQQGFGQQAQQDQLGGQQSGGQQSGQQQQFDTQQGGQFTDQIREHQEVVDSNGNHVGTVDHVRDGQIKLARSDSSDGEHHYVQLSQVAGIDGDKVRLRERGDNDFGQEA